jgi:hypothetical protein
VQRIPPTVTARIAIQCRLDDFTPFPRTSLDEQRGVLLGADELDYMRTGSGDMFGTFAGVDAALGGGNMRVLTLDTATPGLKSGMITVASTSQGVASVLVEIPVSLNVLGLPGDYNHDGALDAADYVVRRNTLGEAGQGLAADGDASGLVDEGDLLVWRAGFGQTAGSAAPFAVPEPATWIAVLTIVALLARFRRPQ